MSHSFFISRQPPCSRQPSSLGAWRPCALRRRSRSPGEWPARLSPRHSDLTDRESSPSSPRRYKPLCSIARMGGNATRTLKRPFGSCPTGGCVGLLKGGRETEGGGERPGAAGRGREKPGDGERGRHTYTAWVLRSRSCDTCYRCSATAAPWAALAPLL